MDQLLVRAWIEALFARVGKVETSKATGVYVRRLESQIADLTRRIETLEANSHQKCGS